MRDHRRAVDAVFGESGFEDRLGGKARQRRQHAAGDLLAGGGDRLAAPVFLPTKEFGAEPRGLLVPVGLKAEHMRGVGGREADDLRKSARDEPRQR